MQQDEWCRLRYVADFYCRHLTGEVRPLEGRPAEFLVVINKSSEVVNKFCFLDDVVEALKKGRIRCDRKKLWELLPVHTSKVSSLCAKGKIY